MKIVCLIDTLNSGGAQRQITNLSILLNDKGYDVSVLYYHDHTHFKDELLNNNILVNHIKTRSKIIRIIKIYNYLRKNKASLIISFLDIPNFYSLIIKLLFPKIKLIVSERVVEIGKPTITRKINRSLYKNADYITTNCFDNYDKILDSNNLYKEKTKVIYNCVDKKLFYPSKQLNLKNEFLVVASFRETKNPLGLFKAFKIIVSNHPGIKIKLNWVGHKNPDSSNNTTKLYDECVAYIEKNNLSNYISINEPSSKIADVYRKHSALILPSYTEGLPNVVCEAMASGLPILMSNVADAKHLVDCGVNGFLFDPYSIQDIKNSILKFINLASSEKVSMGSRSYQMSDALFSEKKFIDSYNNIITQISSN